MDLCNLCNAINLNLITLGLVLGVVQLCRVVGEV